MIITKAAAAEVDRLFHEMNTSHERGGELVEQINRIYEAWEAAKASQPEPLTQHSRRGCEYDVIPCDTEITMRDGHKAAHVVRETFCSRRSEPGNPVVIGYLSACGGNYLAYGPEGVPVNWDHSQISWAFHSVVLLAEGAHPEPETSEDC